MGPRTVATDARRRSNPVLPAVDPPRYLGGYERTVHGEGKPPKLAENRCHEPREIHLNRPSTFAEPTADKSGTFSPTGGEGRDEGVRFMESQSRVREKLRFVLTSEPRHLGSYNWNAGKDQCECPQKFRQVFVHGCVSNSYRQSRAF
jgi:hypothetical protein